MFRTVRDVLVYTRGITTSTSELNLIDCIAQIVDYLEAQQHSTSVLNSDEMKATASSDVPIYHPTHPAWLRDWKPEDFEDFAMRPGDVRVVEAQPITENQLAKFFLTRYQIYSPQSALEIARTLLSEYDIREKK